MYTVRAIIADDELPTAKRLTSMIRRLRPEWNVEMVPGNVSILKTWFSTNPQPDIMFLDIRLEDGTAFDLLNEVRPSGLIVFTTAYSEYALEAFKVNGIDYLLKPVKEEMLSDAISKFERLSVNSGYGNLQKVLDALTQDRNSFRERFMVTKADRLLVVQASDVAFFYSENRHTYAVTSKGVVHQLGMTLDNLVKELDPRYFFRANRQSIVNVSAIVKVEPYFHNSYIITTSPDSHGMITVSKERLSLFKSWLNY